MPKAAMAWSIVPNPLPPEVRVTIATEAWKLNTTTSINSALSVLTNSLLILECVASFPVMWKGFDREVCNKPRSEITTFTKFLQLPSNDSSDFQNLNPVYKGPSDATLAVGVREADYVQFDAQYTATIKFLNFSTKSIGSHVCENDTVSDLRTVIKLEIHRMPESNCFMEPLRLHVQAMSFQAIVRGRTFCKPDSTQFDNSTLPMNHILPFHPTFTTLKRTRLFERR